MIEKSIPKEERLSFGKCEKSVPKRGTFEFWYWQIGESVI